MGHGPLPKEGVFSVRVTCSAVWKGRWRIMQVPLPGRSETVPVLFFKALDEQGHLGTVVVQADVPARDPAEHLWWWTRRRWRRDPMIMNYFNNARHLIPAISQEEAAQIATTVGADLATGLILLAYHVADVRETYLDIRLKDISTESASQWVQSLTPLLHVEHVDEDGEFRVYSYTSEAGLEDRVILRRVDERSVELTWSNVNALWRSAPDLADFAFAHFRTEVWVAPGHGYYEGDLLVINGHGQHIVHEDDYIEETAESREHS